MQYLLYDTKKVEISHSNSGKLKSATMHASAHFSSLTQAGSSFCLDRQSAYEICCSQVREGWAQCSPAGSSTTFSNGIMEIENTEGYRYWKSNDNRSNNSMKEHRRW